MAQITVSINGERLDERIEYGRGGTLTVFRDPEPPISIYREIDGDPLSIFSVGGEFGIIINLPEGGTYPVESVNEKIIIEHGINS